MPLAVKLIAGKDHASFWLTTDDWVDASTDRIVPNSEIPDDLKVFRTEAAADRFMKTFTGHPIWAVPVHSYILINVKRKTRRVQVFDKWEVV